MSKWSRKIHAHGPTDSRVPNHNSKEQPVLKVGFPTLAGVLIKQVLLTALPGWPFCFCTENTQMDMLWAPKGLRGDPPGSKRWRLVSQKHRQLKKVFGRTCIVSNTRNRIYGLGWEWTPSCERRVQSTKRGEGKQCHDTASIRLTSKVLSQYQLIM